MEEWDNKPVVECFLGPTWKILKFDNIGCIFYGGLKKIMWSFLWRVKEDHNLGHFVGSV